MRCIHAVAARGRLPACDGVHWNSPFVARPMRLISMFAAGLPLRIGPGTRIDKAPAADDAVEVRGRIGADDSIDVQRLRRR